MDHLPDELLADILRLLLPRGIAACQAVCKGWRAAVDAGGLLLAVAARAPRPMRGIFVKFSGDGQVVDVDSDEKEAGSPLLDSTGQGRQPLRSRHGARVTTAPHSREYAAQPRK